MANMIKFYRGLVNNLPTTGENGALYITTDEGAIYYGTGTGMKRLGDFIQVANVDALPEKAHESCLYYCVAENILAKWNGSEWKQINKQPTAEELKGLLGLGTLAYKSEVAEADLNADLAAKINASTAVNHSHDNKTVLDGITSEKVAAWDASEKNAKDHADGLNTAMNTRVEAVEAAIGENGSVATQIKTAIEALDYTDTAVDGEYVSAVNEVDGKISVTRKALPDYSETYDAKGAANTAFENAKAYADGLAGNYDEKGAAAGVQTVLEAEIAKKVDKVEGKSLVDDAEITKLAGVSAGANKVEASENGKIKIDGVDTVVYTHPDKHSIDDVTGLQDALDGKSDEGHTHTASEITDLDTTIKAYDYATKAEAQGYADAKDEEIQHAKDLAEGAQAAADSAQETADAITSYVGTFTASEGVDTVVKYIDSKTANIASDERVDGIEDRVEAIETGYVKKGEDICFEGDGEHFYGTTISENGIAIDGGDYGAEHNERGMSAFKDGDGEVVLNITDGLKIADGDYETSFAISVAGDVTMSETTKENFHTALDLANTYQAKGEYYTKSEADAAFTDSTEVDSQIDAKIAALNLGTTYEPIGAEQNAKNYVDQKFTDANLAQYTTEQEVKDIVDGVIAGAADSETYNSLTKLVDYIDTHGGEATEMAQAIETLEGKTETLEGKVETLEGKVETIEGKPAYGISATQISNWDNEVGAKALAETKLDASTFTEYSNAHAGDYTNKQIDDAIDADVKTAIDAEVIRANGAYDTKGAAADAQAAAIADAAGKYETKGTAQGIVDGLKLGETYEPIGAETRAIAAAKTETETQVKALADTVYTKTEVENLMSWGEF